MLQILQTSKTLAPLALAALLAALPVAASAAAAPAISGDYLEARTADVWTGPCFANGEMGLTGKEAILAWRVRQGSWDGVALDGRSVVAVVRADATLGDPDESASGARSLLLVDEAASPEQRRALAAFARDAAGDLLADVVKVEAVPIQVDFDQARSFAHVRAGDEAEISTRALTAHDKHCGNEIVFYPPLTSAAHATPAATVVHAYRGDELGATWSSPGKRSAFVGTFAR